MKIAKPLAAAALLVLLGASFSASAYDADWKRGRIYYRSVCTSCHVALPIGSVNPSSRTMAEWSGYMQADKHAQGKDTVKQYVSKSYRASIKSANKAAEKFAEVPDQELLDDIKAFVTKGAKDGEAPASCS
jgi:cytochrome c5